MTTIGLVAKPTEKKPDEKTSSSENKVVKPSKPKKDV